MQIFGAGYAGLIAANMLRHYQPLVIEAQSSLPNNHGALLRFRSDAVAIATHQQFKEVEVQKGFFWRHKVRSGYPPLDAVNEYSQKVTGGVLPRSIMNLNPSKRWIAPDNFTPRLGGGVNVQYDTKVGLNLIKSNKSHGTVMISTIPMPALMTIVGWPTSDSYIFDSREITTISATISEPRVELYQSIYYPSRADIPYRASITGNKLIIEIIGGADALGNDDDYTFIGIAMRHFGIYGWKVDSVQTRTQKYGKLLPIPEKERRAFILAMTDSYNLYSLGRFGTWRQILLDDIVKDVRVIEQFIQERDEYARKLQWRKESP